VVGGKKRPKRERRPRDRSLSKCCVLEGIKGIATLGGNKKKKLLGDFQSGDFVGRGLGTKCDVSCGGAVSFWVGGRNLKTGQVQVV